MVCLLDRDRHEQLIAHSREAGARVMLISDGDVAGGDRHGAAGFARSTSTSGAGGAPEGVLSAAALRCVGGQMQGRLLYENEEQMARVRAMGHADPKRCFNADELAKGDVMFAATGVTAGADAARGEAWSHGKAITHSIVMRSRSGTVRFIEAHHSLEQKDLAGPRGHRCDGRISYLGVSRSLSGRRGCGGPRKTGWLPGSPSNWWCRRSSAGCWRRAGSASTPPPTSWSRRCGPCCPTRRSWRTWTSRSSAGPRRPRG